MPPFSAPKRLLFDISFTITLESLVLQTIHDGTALVTKRAARLVGMVDPSMRFLVLKARRKETGTITEGHAQLSDGKNKVNNPAEVSARPKKNNNDASHAL